MDTENTHTSTSSSSGPDFHFHPHRTPQAKGAMSAEAEETRPPSTEVGLACLLCLYGLMIIGGVVARRYLSSASASASERAEGGKGGGRLACLPACVCYSTAGRIVGPASASDRSTVARSIHSPRNRIDRTATDASQSTPYTHPWSTPHTHPTHDPCPANKHNPSPHTPYTDDEQNSPRRPAAGRRTSWTRCSRPRRRRRTRRRVSQCV